MSGMNILKSYLVSLGFDLDMAAYEKFNRTLHDAEQKVNKGTSAMAKDYIKASTVVVSALASVGFATVSLMNKIASADLEYKKFAMHMFISKEAAKEMKIATDALGESLEDIAWMPELREKYFALTSQARGMETPKEAEAQLKYIRGIQFEYARLRVAITYGMEWIGYYLFKYLAGPIKKIKEDLASMNDWIQANMPDWSEKIAKALAIVIGVIQSGIRFVKDLFMSFKVLWDAMPAGGKKIALALAVALAPISPAIKIISGLLLLIDDFYAYLDGRKSSKTLAPIWDALITTIDFVTRAIVSAMVLIDNLYGKMAGTNKMTFSEIMSDVRGAWNDIPGVQKPAGRVIKLDPQQLAGNIKDISSKAQYGVDNYKSLAYQSAQSGSAPVASSEQNVKIDIGGVNVSVQGTNATPKEIYQSVKDGIVSASERMALNTRQVVRP